MFNASDYSFTRYLSSKKSVDNRALNRLVWERLRSIISFEHQGRKPSILEIGAGIGTMFERALEWELFNDTHYMAIDAMTENILEARARIIGWGYNSGYDVQEISDDELRLSHSGKEVTLKLQAVDFFELVKKPFVNDSWDIVIANAFLDLVDVRRTLPLTLDLLKPGGLLYFTINFDGATVLEPEIDEGFDALVERLYHRTMDERITDGARSGDSKTGRRFFEIARKNNVDILEAGSSDWTVFPGRNGYREDESYFLHFLVHTMFLALKDRPELDREKFQRWIEKRHSQIENRELVFIAHQLDFLCRKPDIA